MKSVRTIKGKSPKEMYGEMPSKASDKVYPRVDIPLDALPEAKDWKVGKTYDVLLRLTQTGMHMSKGSRGDNGSASFDLVGIAPQGEVKQAKEAKRYSRASKGKSSDVGTNYKRST